MVKTALGLGRVVGAIIPQFETSQLIASGLNVLKSWNPDWKPGYFMTDKSFVELEAIAETFPSCVRYARGYTTCITLRCVNDLFGNLQCPTDLSVTFIEPKQYSDGSTGVSMVFIRMTNKVF